MAMKPIANYFGPVAMPPTDPRYVDGGPGSEVPSVTGLKLDAARKKLADAGFQVAAEPTAVNSSSAKGTVVGTTPRVRPSPVRSSPSTPAPGTSRRRCTSHLPERAIGSERATSCGGTASAAPATQRLRNPRAAADNAAVAGATATSTTGTSASATTAGVTPAPLRR